MWNANWRWLPSGGSFKAGNSAEMAAKILSWIFFCNSWRVGASSGGIEGSVV